MSTSTSHNHATASICFDRFRLDLEAEELRADDELVALTPKAFAVLAHLLRRAGKKVSKAELLETVWDGRHVSDAVLKVAVREIRSALEDQAKEPRFVETLHRHGYRFIGTLKTSAQPLAAGFPIEIAGREAALESLREAYEKALAGQRQLVFVTGDPGIGKTTLVDVFFQRLAEREDTRLAVGRCLEQLGAGEAYLPILEALTRLAREPWRHQTVDLLRRHAPTWLTQLPSLIDPEERTRLQQETLGASPQRMLREMAEAVEAISTDRPLVLLLEDLHWSDYATLDLISLLARRPEPAQLLLLATYRPADARLQHHPIRHLKRELETRRLGRELALGGLDEAAVELYVSRRFDGESPPGLSTWIFRHSDGNPLFMINITDCLVAEGYLARQDRSWQLTRPVSEIHPGLFDSIRQLIERQIDRLEPAEQRLLEAASVVGAEISAEAMAAALGAEPVDVEDGCDRLVEKGQFLAAAGVHTLPNGVTTARYEFSHSLYQQVLYARLSEAKRRRWHHRIALAGEQIYGEASQEIAAELALHFEKTLDEARAVKYLQLAAATVLERHANREAESYLKRALQLVDNWSEDERLMPRLALLQQLGLAQRSMDDMPRAAATFETLVNYAERHDCDEQTVQALLYWMSTLYWIRREDVLEKIELATRKCAQLADPIQRQTGLGYCAHWNLNLRGWSDDDANTFSRALEAARHAGDPSTIGLFVARDVYLRCWQGDYEGAMRSAVENEQRALEAGDPFDRMLGRFFDVWARLHAGRWAGLFRLLQDHIALAEKNDQHVWALLFQIEIAWLHEMAGDPETARRLCLPAVEEARQNPQATGQLLFKSLIVLSHAHLSLDQPDEAWRNFREIRRAAEDRRVLMDQILELPHHHGLARHELQMGRIEAAKRETQRLLDLATAPGERTYQALARQLQAEIALVENDLTAARGILSLALEGHERPLLPLTSWRLHDTLIRVHELSGETAEATNRRQQRAILVRQLAEGIDIPTLRKALLSKI